MKADITKIRETKKNIDSYRKEKGFFKEIAIIDPSRGDSVVTARVYYPGATAYVCLWIYGHENRVYGRGYGKAGGYGYHKESAALADAIRDAGIVLSESIDGVGDGAMTDACLAIAKAISSKRKFITHVAHG